MMKRTATAAAVLLLGAASLTACKGGGATGTCGNAASQTLTRGSGGHGSHGSGGKGTSKSKTHRGGAGHVPHLHRSDMDDSCDD